MPNKYNLILLLLIAAIILLLISGCIIQNPTVPQTGSINILTNPPGAKILFNGNNTEYITPHILTNIPIGSYIITLTLSGYLNSSNIVEVKANQTSSINAYLTPVPTLPPTSPFDLYSIEVQPETMNLKVGESQAVNSITAYYSDSSTADISLTGCIYHTNNPSCASVNSIGVITGISTGTATISVVYTEDLISKTDTITVNVSTTPITPGILSYIEVFPSTMSLSAGETQTISSVTAYYTDLSSKNVNLSECNYTSSNPDCATISNSGTVTAVSDGSSTITISYTENDITKTDTIEITVGTVTQNEIVYRALCVGVGDYIEGSDNDLSAPPYDVNKMIQVFNYCKFGTSNTAFSIISYLKDWQATKSNILQSISSTFSGADNNDISYFYFSGHGSLSGGTSYICPADITSYVDSAISVNELESALSSIPGTKVVFLDSCHSGGFIGKGQEEVSVSQEEIKSFNEDVVDIFSQKQFKDMLTTNQYKVLTSCHYYQYCYELIPPEGDPFGVFTMALCDGCGYDGNYPADTNFNTEVSLQEAYLYVKNWVYSYGIVQDVQVYPNNSTFSIVEY
ncbi:MAG: caspase family protein [Candidatus Caldatribacteriota bacterium]|nr:caspase family protein [Candidatus Caldatribacteriota bacterium]